MLPRHLYLLISCLIAAVTLTYARGHAGDKGTPSPKVARALHWILEQRNRNFGWSSGAESAAALTALELTNWGSKLERELSAKQLEIELVLELWRHLDPTHTHHLSHMQPEQLSHYVLALTAVCHDPTNFYGYNLIGSLVHHESDASSTELVLSSLASCVAGGHIRKRNLRRLLDISKNMAPGKSVYPRELSVYLVLAFKCIIHDHKNRNLDAIIKKPTLALASAQERDGGFGSVHATALAIQAFLDEPHDLWNRSAAVDYILRHQAEDGSFNDIATTADVILALSNRSLHLLRDVNCDSPRNITDSELDSGPTLIAFKAPQHTPLPSPTIPLSTTPETKKTVKESKPITDKKLKSGKPQTLTGKKSAPGSNPMKKGPGQSVTKTSDKVEGDKPEKVLVSYSLWVGTNVTAQHSINISTDANSTFYHVMQAAAETDRNFKFQATEWPNGHYVHTLAGFKEEPNSYHYWLLYRLPSVPDPQHPPGNQHVAPTGVDDLLVENGEHYLFWYKKL
uniref:Uncharacterized protein CG3556 n=1 Tax=Cacopsylla melanoneura TaxID=428564 RepID=A0A8D9EFP7_9HEMI